MKRKLIIASSIISLYCLSSCFFDCEGLSSFAPGELLQVNNYVLLGDFVSKSTLISIGTVNYLGSDKNFSIVEYVFQPKSFFKGDENFKNVYLWSCEMYGSEDHSIILVLDRFSEYLIYGNAVQHPEDLINVMKSSTSYFDELKEWLFKNRKNISDPLWKNTMQADSIIASRVIRNDSLTLILKDRNSKGLVLYGTDLALGTLNEYKIGALCYYENGKSRTVSRESYLRKLESIASANIKE
ncbi:hypothetical protein L0244_24025 [bacterium]|nr:hypothetical protein [bacterium]